MGDQIVAVHHEGRHGQSLNDLVEQHFALLDQAGFARHASFQGDVPDQDQRRQAEQEASAQKPVLPIPLLLFVQRKPFQIQAVILTAFLHQGEPLVQFGQQIGIAGGHGKAQFLGQHRRPDGLQVIQFQAPHQLQAVQARQHGGIVLSGTEPLQSLFGMIHGDDPGGKLVGLAASRGHRRR